MKVLYKFDAKSASMNDDGTITIEGTGERLWKCDRCGATSMEEMEEVRYNDLCVDCAESFEDWLNNPEVPV